MSHREFAFSLVGLFSLTTFAVIGLILTRRVGPEIPLLLISVPIPVFVYLLLVRTWMRRISADDQRSHRLENGLFVVGFVIVIFVSLAMAGIALGWIAGFHIAVPW